MGSADSALNQTPPALSQPVISVFGSSRCTEASDLYQLTRGLGDAIARAGFAVATGGYGGVMEAVSRGAAESGGIVIGVVDHAGRSKANQWLSERIVVDTWRQRLHTLMDLGDGYVVCQGGTGTLVILEHGGDNYSLYGYLESAGVEQGDLVDNGAELGRVGLAPAGPPALYFEMRIDGRSVDPLQWLRPR